MSGESGGAALKGCILVAFLGGLAVVVGAAVFVLLGGSTGDEEDGPPTAARPATTRPVDPPEPAAPVAPAGAAVERVRARGTLLVGMDTGEPPMAGTPPMFFVDAQGGRDGFDYALSRVIAERIGVRDVEIVHAKYSELEGLLLDPAPRVDVVVSGYTPTDTPGIAWSEPYLEYGLCLVVPTGSSVRTTQDLFGKRVGIFDDDAAAADVQRLVKGYTDLVRMEDGYWEALLAGRFDGFLYDYPYTVAELQQLHTSRPETRGKLRIAQYNLTDSTYAVGVRAPEADLLAAVNEAIGAWRASEAYPAAVKRYLKGGEAIAATPAGARVVKVQRGDTLSGIARRELGSVDRWTELWAKNRDRFPNPHLIEVGDEVVLP